MAQVDCLDESDTETVFLPVASSPQGWHVKHYPVNYTHHPSTYTKTLYDVEGNLLVDDHGVPLHVWDTRLKDALEHKTVRCIHVCMQRPGYRYFVTSQSQMDDFQKNRDMGYAPRRRVMYHVYDDEPGVTILPRAQVSRSVTTPAPRSPSPFP
jgi:hypothetical protein